MDNYGTHKTALIRNWFAKRPRFHVHFTPTYGSWINLVERWFAEITNQRIRRGVFRSVQELEAAIREYIDVHNRRSQTLRLDAKRRTKSLPASLASPSAPARLKPLDLHHESLGQETSPHNSRFLKTRKASYGTNTLLRRCLNGQRRLSLGSRYHNTVSVVSRNIFQAGGRAI